MKISYILKVLLFTGLYFILAKTGLLLALDEGFASPVWLGSGTALVILLFYGTNMWPAISMGSFLVNWMNGGSVEFSLVVSLGNTLEALATFKILNYLDVQSSLLLKLKSVVTFLCASAIGAIVSASFGVFAYWMFQPGEINLVEITGTWWLGNFTSFLLIVPAVLLFDKSVLFLLKNYLSYVSIPLTIIACLATFLVDYSSAVLPSIFLYTLFIFPIFAALTQNRISALLHVLIIEFFAVISTYNAKGPFVFPELNNRLLILQAFMSALTIVTLVISVGVKEKELIREELDGLLAEKETLLSEIHHRIKNNLAIVSSLLYLQNETIEDEEVRNKISQTDLRIKAIALVHERLYKKANISTVEFSGYIQALAQMIYRIYESNINLVLKLEKIDLPIEKAQPLGLIINELITNSFKHAFTNTSGGEIEIRFQYRGKETGYFLLVRDNGQGMSAHNSTETLGTTLINVLAEQIDAEVKVKVQSGTTYEFYFK